MPLLLAPTDYPAIRAALDLALQAKDLPDSVIELPIYLGKAEQSILQRDPEATTRTGTEQQHIKNAVIFTCAALLAPAMRNLQRERVGEWEGAYQAMDWTKRATELRALADEELAAVLEPAPTPGPETTIPIFFALANGRRG